MEKRKKTSLSIKFSLFIIPIIFIGITTLLLVVYFRTYSGVYELQSHNLLQSSSILREEFDEIIKHFSEFTLLNSKKDVIKESLISNNFKNLTNIKDDFFSLKEYIESIFLVNSEGFIIFHTTKADEVGVDIKTSHLFWKEIFKKDVYIDHTVYKSPISESAIFEIASPIFDDNKNIIGSFVVVADLLKLSNKFLLDKKFGESGYPFMFDYVGLSIAHSNKDVLFNISTVGFPAIESKERNGIFDYMWYGEKKYMAFSKLDSVNWILGTSIYEKDLLSFSFSIIPILVIVGFSSILLIIIVILFVVRFLISRPLKKIDNMLETISKGNLTIEQAITKSKDEIGSLTNSANVMLNSLQNMVIHINGSVEQITIGTSQISDSSQSLSMGASKQAASLEEITASVNEIASQVQSNVENSRMTNEIATQTSDNAIRGNNQMKELVLAMEDINKSAQEIKNIVKVIDEIAFQTNLLALNADIEAARVGKYGRGFAVVANSVRTLAGRSAIAVKETTDMVEKAIKNVNHGNELVKKTAEQLESITHDASEVTRLATEVADASQEQANGIEQISTGLGQIEEVTQSNSANAEENAAASEELASQSAELKELVSYFKVRSGEINYSKDTSQKNTNQLDNKKSLTPYVK